MVRHGQSQHNAHSIVAGQRETPLTLLGREQAKAAGREAAHLHIDYIVCSPMGRARETAEIIATEIDYPLDHIVLLPDLRERNLGQLEGKSYAQDHKHNGNYRLTEDIPGVEPLGLLHQRVSHALHVVLQSTHKNVLIVCHMNVGRMLRVLYKNGAPINLYDTERLENAKIYRLQ